MSNNEASNDKKTAKKAPISRQSMKRSRRTQQAIQPATSPNSTQSSSIEKTHALVVSSRRKRYTDNRPVDPSPIVVAQTVRLAGNRPIQASPGMSTAARPNFNDSPQIMNRPIAPNTSADEEELLGYLD